MVVLSPTHARGIARTFLRGLPDGMPAAYRSAVEKLLGATTARIDPRTARSFFLSSIDGLRKLPAHPFDIDRRVRCNRATKEIHVRGVLQTLHMAEIRRSNPTGDQDAFFEDASLIGQAFDASIAGKECSLASWTTPGLVPLHALARAVERGGADASSLRSAGACALSNAALAVTYGMPVFVPDAELLLPAPGGAWICSTIPMRDSLQHGWLGKGGTQGGVQPAHCDVPAVRIHTYYPEAWLKTPAKEALARFEAAGAKLAQEWGLAGDGDAHPDFEAAVRACMDASPKGRREAA